MNLEIRFDLSTKEKVEQIFLKGEKYLNNNDFTDEQLVNIFGNTTDYVHNKFGDFVNDRESMLDIAILESPLSQNDIILYYNGQLGEAGNLNYLVRTYGDNPTTEVLGIEDIVFSYEEIAKLISIQIEFLNSLKTKDESIFDKNTFIELFKNFKIK